MTWIHLDFDLSKEDDCLPLLPSLRLTYLEVPHGNLDLNAYPWQADRPSESYDPLWNACLLESIHGEEVDGQVCGLLSRQVSSEIEVIFYLLALKNLVLHLREAWAHGFFKRPSYCSLILGRYFVVVNHPQYWICSWVSVWLGASWKKLISSVLSLNLFLAVCRIFWCLWCFGLSSFHGNIL